MPNDPAEFFTSDELARSRAYQRPLTRLRLLRTALALATVVAFVALRVGPAITDALAGHGWVLQLLAVMAAMELANLFYDPWLDAWVDLGHDRRWGLSTQTGRGLAADLTKSLLLALVVNAVLLVPVYALMRSTPWWWLWAWLVVTGFGVAFGFLFPVVIAPIFNRFTPLDDADLAARIEGVAERAGVSLTGAWVADASRRSRRDNAYVAGLGATRRMVLYDTLLEHPPEVVEQVVAHEIGHWRRRHLLRQLPFSAAAALIAFAGLKLASGWDGLFDAVGVSGVGDPAGLPLVLLGFQLAFAVLGLAGAWLSRAFEREADLEALELLGDPSGLADMHRRLHTKNLADLDPSWLTRLRASHPPVAERMELARLGGER